MQYFPSNGRVNSIIWMYHMDADLVYREKDRRELDKNDTSYIEQFLEATPHKTAAVRPPNSHL